jgi:hypothetical protein
MPSPGDRVRIALVDLTGDKLTRPDFAGWGSTAAIYAASVAKILAVYAAHQLRVDLRMLAAQQSITTGAALEKAALQVWKIRAWAPNLVWLFDIRRWSGTPTSLDFSKAARDALTDIMHNEAAGAVIAGVGFPYMASVTWQSGLYHANRGGLWLSSSYGKGEWGGNPVPAPYSANATALSVATYFTLMAQRRLVDEPSSIDIETVLGRGCVTGGFPLPAVASKCGIWSNYLHDCALVVRGATRYVVVGLTRTNPSEYTHYKQLFLELDNLIVQNNQKPKPVC